MLYYYAPIITIPAQPAEEVTESDGLIWTKEATLPKQTPGDLPPGARCLLDVGRDRFVVASPVPSTGTGWVQVDEATVEADYPGGI